MDNNNNSLSTILFKCTVFVVVLNISIVLVHLVCPAKVVDGYVCDVVKLTTPLKYRLNGLMCLCIFVMAFGLAFHFSNDYYKEHYVLILSYNYMLCTFLSNVLGLVLSAYLVYIRFPRLSLQEKQGNAVRRAPTYDGSSNNKPSSTSQQLDTRRAEFFNGREFTPRWKFAGRELDIKMVLYLVGAIVLELNILSAVGRERLENDGKNSHAMMIYAVLFTWFCCEYLYFEQIHLYTYDLFAEKMGFKLAWGCLCFYPYFYPIGVFPMLYNKGENDITTLQAVGIVLLFVIGWILTRGANLQKYYFRKFPKDKKVFGGLLKQTTLASSDKILCSGFWALAKHVNYLGEILQAIALALPGFLVAESMTMKILPLLYPLYYVALFIPRQWDDEEIMKQKYGHDIMEEYTTKVPYRIVPYIY